MQDCTAQVYRPRRPQTTDFYRILEKYFDTYVFTYEERFEPSCGPLRSVVRISVEAFLGCGRPEGGFARIKCPDCKAERLLTFSCRTRWLCPSCQAKRAALFAEKLVDDLLAPVPHRHYVFTIPLALRGLFKRERRLLGLLARCAYEAVRLCFEQLFERKDVRAGCVISLQTAGSYAANFHPHAHCLITEGVYTGQGEFVPLPSLDTKAIEEVFRRLILRRLHQAERLSETFIERLLSWSPSGFSVHAQHLVRAEDTTRMERLARYLTKPPVPIDSVSEQDDGTVRVSTPPHPSTGRRECRLNVLDWIHALTTHVPDPGQHTLRYFGAYACRRRLAPRRAASPESLENTEQADAQPVAKPRRSSWARLIKRLFEVDPLLCGCGGAMVVVSFITEPKTIDHILNHLRRKGPTLFDPSDSPEARAPPF
ncbi:transposase [Acidobacteriota bacterium]